MTNVTIHGYGRTNNKIRVKNVGYSYDTIVGIYYYYYIALHLIMK